MEARQNLEIIFVNHQHEMPGIHDYNQASIIQKFRILCWLTFLHDCFTVAKDGYFSNYFEKRYSRFQTMMAGGDDY